MVGSSGDVNQGTTAGGEKRACRGQSVRSSWEAGNDRGAKGRRNVVVAAGLDPTQKGRPSAARLIASERRRVVWGQTDGGQWAAWEQVSGAGRLARLVRCFRTPCDECLSQPIRTTNWKARCGRPACPVGFTTPPGGGPRAFRSPLVEVTGRGARTKVRGILSSIRNGGGMGERRCFEIGRAHV